MKKLLDTKRFLFYCRTGLAVLVLWVWHDMSTFDVSFGNALLNNVWRMLYIIPVNHVFFEFAVPFIARKRSYLVLNILVGIAVVFVFMILWSFGLYRWRGLGVVLHIYKPLGENVAGQVLTSQMAFSMGSLVFFAVVRHIFRHIRLQQAEQQLRIEKQAAELNYLRAQTNPHFLFNTLNNIYSLARDKSDLAPESILRLSKILRFMLYETSGEFISVEQELKIITDYIALEKLRYDDSLTVNLNHDIEEMKQALPPLLLIPLVENAFKHGVSETRGHPFINIHIAIKRRQLTCRVENSSETAPGDKEVKENIGLSNLRRQLELLYRDYNLSVHQGGSVFTAVLQINLNSHV
jgi:sensor histidine kinase YesM